MGKTQEQGQVKSSNTERDTAKDVYQEAPIASEAEASAKKDSENDVATEEMDCNARKYLRQNDSSPSELETTAAANNNDGRIDDDAFRNAFRRRHLRLIIDVGRIDDDILRQIIKDGRIDYDFLCQIIKDGRIDDHILRQIVEDAIPHPPLSPPPPPPPSPPPGPWSSRLAPAADKRKEPEKPKEPERPPAPAARPALGPVNEWIKVLTFDVRVKSDGGATSAGSGNGGTNN